MNRKSSTLQTLYCRDAVYLYVWFYFDLPSQFLIQLISIVTTENNKDCLFFHWFLRALFFATIHFFESGNILNRLLSYSVPEKE